MRGGIIILGAGAVAAVAGAIGGQTVEPATYPWILWTWFGAIVMGACWAAGRAVR